MLNKFLKYLAIASVLGATVAKAAEVEYTDQGVLRKGRNCEITFVNFGIEDDIKNLGVNKNDNNLNIQGLKNGNLGLNKKGFNYSFNNNEIKNYVKISQNNNAINDFDVTSGNDGKFSLNIRNINSCEGLIIKQTFKEPVAVATYLLYSNIKPSANTINNVYAVNEFGPSSNDVPYDVVHWDMNTGLDSAREKCGIYIEFRDK